MASSNLNESQLIKKHEEILGRRAVLLQQMEVCHEQQRVMKKQRAITSQAARERNAQILEDFQKVEDRLLTRRLLHPDVLNLQTCYWVSVEQQLPEWESYLLGKSKPPVREERQHQETEGTEQDSSPEQSKGRFLKTKARSAM